MCFRPTGPWPCMSIRSRRMRTLYAQLSSVHAANPSPAPKARRWRCRSGTAVITVPTWRPSRRSPERRTPTSSSGIRPWTTACSCSASCRGLLTWVLVDPTIAVPRQETPRLKVAAGSVGIAGAQTGVYPFESPGGWQVIGRTPLARVRCSPVAAIALCARRSSSVHRDVAPRHAPGSSKTGDGVRQVVRSPRRQRFRHRRSTRPVYHGSGHRPMGSSGEWRSRVWRDGSGLSSPRKCRGRQRCPLRNAGGDAGRP